VVHALGDHAGAFDLGLFRASKDGGSPRADLVDALPRRLIVTTEASDRWELHADAIKRLTGNDTQKARTLYARTSVERRPAFLPIIATNSAPRIVGADTALWRRLVVIPFDTTVVNEDEHLGERLRTDETDAVLRWMIDGYNAYAAAGLGTTPDACLEAAERMRADLSLIDAWLADCTACERNATESVADLAQSFHHWCDVNWVPEREQISTPALGKQLTARGYTVDHAGPEKRRYRVRTGLRLTDRDATTGNAPASDSGRSRHRGHGTRAG
jgi:phage/plasmid-associated DNA primase